MVWAHPSLRWASSLPFAAAILIGLLTIGGQSTALQLIGVALLAVSGAVFAANLVIVRRRHHTTCR
jgi:drug/metabolite transporter (DMT)-like permease